jgi:hypothetical protein
MKRITLRSRIVALMLLAGLGAITPPLSATPLTDGQEPLAGAPLSPTRTVLQDGAATARLKAQGQYESLAQAVQAARYAIGPADGDLGPVGGGPAASGYYAGNPAQALRCWFRADGLELQPATVTPWKLNLRVVGYGRATLESADVGAVSADQNRVELSRADGAVVEWYENRPAGLEQGFTLQRSPRGEGWLRLVLEAEGDLRPEPDEPLWGSRSGDSAERRQLAVPGEEVRRSTEPSLRRQEVERASAVNFVTADGQAMLRYSGLKVRDAGLRSLPAHIEVQDRQLALVVDDGNAIYPVTVDPLITSQETPLTPSAAAAGDFFGYAVSLSADGNTALVGAYRADTPAGTNAGSAYVFVRNGTNWTEQATLTAGNGAAVDEFGWAVSLSADGSTALVGAHGTDLPTGVDAGRAYVFVRSGNTWTQQAELASGDLAPYDWFGSSVCLSADGNTALVGATGDDGPAGANAVGSAYVFVRSLPGWRQLAKLTPDTGGASDHFGCSVSLSGDGQTALIGVAWEDTTAGSDVGSARVFVRSGMNWTEQARLVAGNGTAGDQFGWSVSLSGDGNTALVGANAVDLLTGADAGRAYVFVRIGNTWVSQAELASGDLAPYDWFGSSVSLSGDGNVALIGATGDDTPAGANAAGSVYVFGRSGSTWHELGKVRSSHGGAANYFGCSVSLSWDGNTTLVGAFRADTDQGIDTGGAYVFVRNRTNWVPEVFDRVDKPISNERFGAFLSLSGDGNTALVGVPGQSLTPSDYYPGNTYVYVRTGSTWGVQALLPLGGIWHRSSISLSGDGNTALVAAWELTGSMMETYASFAEWVYVRRGGSWDLQWSQTAAPFPSIGRGLGCATSLSWDGNTALMGWPGSRVTVYVRNDNVWSRQADLRSGSELGVFHSLSGDGDTALISGSPYAESPRVEVHVRTGTTWSRQAQLPAGYTVRLDSLTFGQDSECAVSLSRDGNTALVGGDGETVWGLEQAGKAHVYVRRGTVWTLQADLISPAPAALDHFGWSVSLSGDGNRALIGAPGEVPPFRASRGRAYVFERVGGVWSQSTLLSPAVAAPVDSYGLAVSLSADGTTALVGAPYVDTEAGLDAGSVYVFRLPPVIEPPQLFVERLGQSLILCWWPVAPGFGLEATDDLVSPAWSPVPGSSPVTIPLSGAPKFYRLKKP